MTRSKKSFKDMTPAGKSSVSALVVVSLMLIAAAQRDITRRPASQLRGGKRLWRVVCLNGLGAAAYFSWGRRRG
jgi:hypothetical protein